MTTIAWRPGEIAADTLVTAGYRRAEATKIAARNGVLAAAAGGMERSRYFLDWFRSGMRGDVFDRLGPVNDDGNDTGAFGWVFFMDVILEFTPMGVSEQRAAYYAMGSGAHFATGAMAVGASPRDAIIAAMRHDTITGGAVHVLRGRR